MDKNEVFNLLSRLGNEKRKTMYIKNGASENTYGVLLGELRKIVKRIGKNHTLGLELWNSKNTEAVWVASMIIEANELTLDEIKNMVSDLTYKDMIDKFVSEVVVNHKEREVLAKEWAMSKEDNLGRAGWNIIVNIISKDKLSNEKIEKILKVIEENLQSSKEKTKWVMNHALCAIGINYDGFTERCIGIGERLAVYKELKVSKGCTSAYAPNWIEVGLKQRKKK